MNFYIIIYIGDKVFIEIPDYILKAIKMIENNHCKAYIVGGCVRDAILGKEPNDWDICTSAKPEKICEIFKDYNLVLSGLKHGTVCVIINHLPVEITTFRIDGDYKDNRRPENVTFSTCIEDDLKRRDFTINAMAYSESDGLIDVYGGIKDIKNKVLRCVGNATTRFDEDALRIMRGLRFAGQLGFAIEEETKEAIFSQKELLKNISAERITDEFVKLIMSENYFDILAEFESVIKVFLPSFSVPVKVDIKPDMILRLSYILSASCPQNMFGALKLPKSVSGDVKTILSNRDYKLPQSKAEAKYMLNRFGTQNTDNILEFKSLLGEDVSIAPNLITEILSNNECYSIKQLDISGTDIMDLGFKGAEIGNILNNLLNEVISDKVKNTKSDLISHIKKGM